MRCIECGRLVDIPERAYRNVDSYGGSRVARSGCCGAPYVVTRSPKYEIEPYRGDSNVDDWGESILRRHAPEKKAMRRPHFLSAFAWTFLGCIAMLLALMAALYFGAQ